MSTKITWKELLKKTADDLCVVSWEDTHIDELVRSAPRQTAARTVRGNRCTSKARTLQEWAAVLQFPSYFGENWDAFEDCVRDLEWLNARRVVVFVTSADGMLLRSSKDFATLIDILFTAQKETPMLTVFQCAADQAVHLRQRIRNARRSANQ